MKVLLVTMYFPPAGGGGVQRPLKTATHLPALGIETHVLAPVDPKWLHRDEELLTPTQAFVHRARYLGPRARLPAEELHGLEGTERVLAQARLAYRRVLLPDASVTWLPTAVPAAVRLIRSEDIDAVITTSPPVSMNLIGAAVKRLTGVPWVADLRDAVLGNADRRFERTAVQAKEKALERVVRLVAGNADAVGAAPLGLGDRLGLLPSLPHRRALELERDSEANLLLLPEAAGRGAVVPSGKIFEYLAAERPILAAVPPDGAAAKLVRETGAGIVVAPEDEKGIREALLGLHARWQAGQLSNGYLSPEQRRKLSREARVEELAELLFSLE